MRMSEDQDWKEKYQEFKMLQEQIEHLTQHLQQVHGATGEIDNSIEALQSFAATEKGKEVFAPIANGIFIKTTLNENSTLLVNVGADTVVEKSVTDIIELLGKQQKDMKKRAEEVEKILLDQQQTAMKIITEVQSAEEK